MSGLPSADPRFLVRFADAANEMTSVRACKRRIEAFLDPRIGQQILDLGCGTGDDARALARLVGADGRVVGIDNSDAMLAEARRRSEGLDLPLELMLGDVQQLHGPDDAFDACRAERIFMHLKAPDRALAEMLRVTRPGGKVVVFELDWDTLLVDHPLPYLTQKVFALMTECFPSARIGRRLPAMFDEAGLHDVAVAPHTVVMHPAFFRQLLGGTLQRAQEEARLSTTEIASWLEPLDAVSRLGRFFAAITGFIVAGRKRA